MRLCEDEAYFDWRERWSPSSLKPKRSAQPARQGVEDDETRPVKERSNATVTEDLSYTVASPEPSLTA